MKNLIFDYKEQTLTPDNRDRIRFDKLLGKKEKVDLTCIHKDEKQIIRFAENNDPDTIVEMEIDYVNSAGDVYMVRMDDSNLSNIRILISPGCKVLIAYQINEKESIKYCSWGYKTSSAITDKFSAFFRTSDMSWFIYLDTQHPEHTIFLKGESEEWDCVQNVHNLMKSLNMKEDAEHEKIL